MRIAFADLPYAVNALEPHCSAKTLEFHHGKHHRAYFDKTAALIAGTKFADMTVEEIVQLTAGDPKNRQLFNNAAQLWNHDMFWRSMSPEGGGPQGDLKKMIERDFSSCDALCEMLKDKAVKQFGSGWAWLVYDNGRLSVASTHDAENPLVNGGAALIALDVWEHAYYLDYQNRRPDFIEAFLAHLVNWDYAAEMLEAAASARRAVERPHVRQAR